MVAQRIRAIAMASIVIAAACMIATFFVASENTIYFWDYGGYFNQFKQLGALFAQGNWSWLTETVTSIRHTDYNASPIVPLLPVYALFGGDRSVYIVSLVVFYLLPACLVLATLAQLGTNGLLKRPDALPLWLLATAFLYWPLWAPTLRGLPDVAGLLPLGFATMLLLRPDLWRARPILKGALIGLLIWGTFLLRRWYAYSCLSLLVITGAYYVFIAIKNKEDRTKMLQTTFLLFGSCGLAMGLLLLMQWPLIERILATDYADQYEHFQRPLVNKLAMIFDNGGPLILIGALAGLVRSALIRNWRVPVMSASALLSFVIFSRTQAPDLQHLLPWFFWLFPAFVMGVSWPFESRSRRHALALVPALVAISFATVFSPLFHRQTAAARVLLPRATYFPLQLDNMNSYRTLASDLHDVLSDGGDLGVIGFGALSRALLSSMDPSLDPYLANTGRIDGRDGFKLPVVEARFAVVTDEPSPPRGGQTVLTIPQMLIRSEGEFGAGYRRIRGPYVLADGATAYIYERERPLSDEERQSLIAKFLTIYPNWVVLADGVGPDVTRDF